MLFRDTIQEYEFDCCSRKMAPRAVGGYIKMLGYLADYLEQNHKITELEEIKGMCTTYLRVRHFLLSKSFLRFATTFNSHHSSFSMRVSILFDTGMRLNEVVSLKREQIHEEYS